MKKQTGGKLTCHREKTEDNCITDKCVDYEKEIIDAIKHTDCTTDAKKNDWRMYYDEEAEAYYWYNNETGEATWIPQKNEGGKSKKRQKKRKTNKKRKTKRNKKI